ncbi:hypothetical protein T552_02686 [Pneumocystis carinii B80]|uniref:Iron hydrogenase large subunit C-terminal domain-containing protein n=1 Tax=Pneumocystis carinii (strain B80) TaxID=1408658 RepID=A0A0W4ZE77_PNEC8|nr:hypothetical protein T552_02686 [Pneumocystis carinii B80]KTW26678.1 hypothetical protein T552_02686 [Pneumocystis carinii B80]
MSKILSAEYLNDFISPSQACIKPIDIKRNTSNNNNIKIDKEGYYELDNDGVKKKLEPVSISLSDCLSCSGCITSAESVFIKTQSCQKINEVIIQNIGLDKNEQKILIASISPQSRASIAAAFNLSIKSTHARLAYFFTKILPFSHFIDTNFGRELALNELSNEFIRRYKAKKNGTENQLPLLTSACPGWICYAEKTHTEILPYISHVKSPQQIMGSIVKSKLEKSSGKHRQYIYYVSIMPCFDKKLEASRDEFSENGVRDVDCVITTTEVIELLKERSLDLRQIPEASHDSLFSHYIDSDIIEHPGSSSGGYLAHILSFSTRELFNIDDTNANIEHNITMNIIRNNDMREYVLKGPNDTVLRMATCYGFRNIQNLIRKLKTKKNRISQETGYDFVEVMACPSGCINGGGQLKPEIIGSSKTFTHKEWIDYVNELYDSSIKKTVNSSHISQYMKNFDKQIASKFLYTTYRSIQQDLTKKINQEW